ncbi:MAG: shikimate dehydrogenase [Candidatus Omnitrophica bacterium]|nr:shikimate dehydrogenase [Candidatus Omnitrophota bacterium]
MEPKIYGVLGYPVKHSFSPAMHNAAFRQLHIDAEYRYFEKKPEDLDSFMSSLPKEGILGLNVTVPYKEKVILFLAKVSAEARLIGAVNTIKVTGSVLEGFNTDGAGFLKHLKEDLEFEPRGKDVALIGSGGAARAITVYLAKDKVKRISLFDIDLRKAQILLAQLKSNFKDTVFYAASSIEDLGLSECDLLVNATPVGMKVNDPCLVPEKLLHRDLLVYDLIYNPKETKLLSTARERGLKTANGLGMLLYQGALSFEIWIEKKPPLEAMRQALMEVVYK